MIQSSVLGGHKSDDNTEEQQQAPINKVYRPLYTSNKRYFF